MGVQDLSPLLRPSKDQNDNMKILTNTGFTIFGLDTSMFMHQIGSSSNKLKAFLYDFHANPLLSLQKYVDRFMNVNKAFLAITKSA